MDGVSASRKPLSSMQGILRKRLTVRKSLLRCSPGMWENYKILTFVPLYKIEHKRFFFKLNTFLNGDRAALIRDLVQIQEHVQSPCRLRHKVVVEFNRQRHDLVCFGVILLNFLLLNKQKARLIFQGAVPKNTNL